MKKRYVDGAVVSAVLGRRVALFEVVLLNCSIIENAGGREHRYDEAW